MPKPAQRLHVKWQALGQPPAHPPASGKDCNSLPPRARQRQ